MTGVGRSHSQCGASATRAAATPRATHAQRMRCARARSAGRVLQHLPDDGAADPQRLTPLLDLDQGRHRVVVNESKWSTTHRATASDDESALGEMRIELRGSPGASARRTTRAGARAARNHANCGCPRRFRSTIRPRSSATATSDTAFARSTATVVPSISVSSSFVLMGIS